MESTLQRYEWDNDNSKCCMLGVYMYMFIHMYFYSSNPDFDDNDILGDLEGRVHK
jgi:hypothetical protein